MVKLNGFATGDCLNKSKGFTLIELMIATSLLMMVMFSGYYAYSLYSQKWQKRVQVFWQSTEQSIAIDSLNKMLSSTLPYVVNGKNDKACIFFKGTNSQLTFVTSSAIFSTEPALVQINLVQNNESYQLIYQEQSIGSNLVVSIGHEARWQHKISLINNISNFNLSYFGWPTFEQATMHSNNDDDLSRRVDNRTWYQNHSANSSRILPEKIQLDFTINQTTSTFEVLLPQHTLYNLLAYLRVDA